MHMADALISPAVGGVMWAGTAAVTAHACWKVKQDLNDKITPLMGVMGAFVFTAQMINFSIPGTGSSGHLGGGLLLAILLGPHAAFITMASILSVQALLFADGGLLALGCNIFNLGFFPCYLAYPLIFKPLMHGKSSRRRLISISLFASVIALLLGALFVVFQTRLSGISALPFGPFLLAMGGIHLAIGLVEGGVTAGLVTVLGESHPEMLQYQREQNPAHGLNWKWALTMLLCIAFVTGGALSWFASSQPDGLEWSVSRASGLEELEAPKALPYRISTQIQEKTALLPEYALSDEAAAAAGEPASLISVERSFAGVVGGAMTLLLLLGIGVVVRKTAAVRHS